MKKLIILMMLMLNAVSMFAQKTTDFTTYDVLAKAGDVSIIVKDNDWRMVVGSLKKSKLNMLMGYSKEQAVSTIDRILDFSKSNYTKNNRNVSVCGVMFLLTITGDGDNEKCHFDATDKISILIRWLMLPCISNHLPVVNLRLQQSIRNS